MAAAASRRGRIDLEREPDLGRGQLARRKLESRRHYANDIAGIAADPYVVSDDRTVAAESSLPKSEGEDGGQRDVGTVILGREETPDHRLHPEHRQHAAGDIGGRRANRFTLAGQVYGLCGPAVDLIERGSVALEVQILRRRDPEVA